MANSSSRQRRIDFPEQVISPCASDFQRRAKKKMATRQKKLAARQKKLATHEKILRVRGESWFPEEEEHRRRRTHGKSAGNGNSRLHLELENWETKEKLWISI
jgi:hypothetical protein